MLTKEGTEFLIDKGWVMKSKQVLEELYLKINQERITPSGVDSIEGEVSVFRFDSLNKMMKFWEEIISDWYKNFQKGDPNINCWQGAHSWEALLHLDTEKRIMGQLKDKGIVSYALSTGSTPLDKNLWEFYKKIGLKVRLYPSSKSFDRTYYVGTYGETIVQLQIPERVSEKIDTFFKKNKSIKKLDLNELIEIVNLKQQIKLTVIKNLGMSKQINSSIISQFD